MGVKNFLTRKMLERHLKKLPEGQRAMFMKMFEKDPALFEKIAKEVKEKKDQGQDEMLATVAVMKKYQSEMQQLMRTVQKTT